MLHWQFFQPINEKNEFEGILCYCKFASRMLSCLAITIFQNENIYIQVTFIRSILLEQSISSCLKREDKCKRVVCLMCVLFFPNKQNQHQSRVKIYSQGHLLSSTISDISPVSNWWADCFSSLLNTTDTDIFQFI